MFDRQNFVCNHSKHRPIFSPPHTPERYWDVGFDPQADVATRDHEAEKFADDTTYRTVMENREHETPVAKAKWMRKGDLKKASAFTVTSRTNNNTNSPKKASKKTSSAASEDTDDDCLLLVSPKKTNPGSSLERKGSNNSNNSSNSANVNSSNCKSSALVRTSSRSSPSKWTKTKK